MTYYKTSIMQPCQESWCRKKATHEIFNGQNSSYGFYCKACADKKLFVLKKGND